MACMTMSTNQPSLLRRGKKRGEWRREGGRGERDNCLVCNMHQPFFVGISAKSLLFLHIIVEIAHYRAGV